MTDVEYYYFSEDDINLANDLLDKVHQQFPNDSQQFISIISDYPIYIFLSYVANPDIWMNDQKRCGSDYIIEQLGGIDSWVTFPQTGRQLVLTDSFTSDIQKMTHEVDSKPHDN